MHGGRAACILAPRMGLIFFNNQSGDEVIRAMQAARRRDAKVVLSHTLVREIRSVLALSSPQEDTVLLLRPEHKKSRSSERVWDRWMRALGAVVV